MKKTKRLEKIRRNPRAVRPTELEAALLDAGFSKEPGNGSSHQIFRQAESGQKLSIPYRKPFLLEVYVKEALQAIDNAAGSGERKQEQ